MEYDKLMENLYQENVNWVYSIIKELNKSGIEKKEKFIKDPYNLNNMLVIGFYFMNLYVVSNINNFDEDDANHIMMSIINGASSYNQKKLSQIYKKNIDINKIVDQYNSVVNKTKMYAPEDGLKARVVVIDEVYRRLYDKFNKRHFNAFVKIFMCSFNDFEESINNIIKNYLKNR